MVMHLLSVLFVCDDKEFVNVHVTYKALVSFPFDVTVNSYLYINRISLLMIICIRYKRGLADST